MSEPVKKEKNIILTIIKIVVFVIIFIAVARLSQGLPLIPK